jgi:hypothetical protein
MVRIDQQHQFAALVGVRRRSLAVVGGQSHFASGLTFNLSELEASPKLKCFSDTQKEH